MWQTNRKNVYFCYSYKLKTRMDFIEKMKKPIQSEIMLFESAYSDLLSSESDILAGVYDYSNLKNSGRFHPVLVLLSAHLIDKSNEKTIYGAIAMDLLHTARLIHQDVLNLDNLSAESASVGARWTNKMATLSGDYVLSKSLSSALKTENIQILNAVSTIGMHLSDAELSQLAQHINTDYTEDSFYSFANSKTANLISNSLAVGAYSVGATQQQVDALVSFGYNVGVAMQIQSDIDNFQQTEFIARNFHINKGEKSLALAFALKNANETDLPEIKRLLELPFLDDNHVQSIVDFVKKNKGLELTAQQLNVCITNAQQCLIIFQESEIKTALQSVLCHMEKQWP